MTNEQKRRPEPSPQPKKTLNTAVETEHTQKRMLTSSSDLNKQQKSNHAPSSLVTKSKLKEKNNKYIQLLQERQNGVPQNGHKVQTPSPSAPPHSPCPSQFRSEKSPTLPQTNTDGLSYCSLSDAPEFTFLSAAGPETLESQLVVCDCSPCSQKILTEDEACQYMTQLADYMKDPCFKGTKVWASFEAFLKVLQSAS